MSAYSNTYERKQRVAAPVAWIGLYEGLPAAIATVSSSMVGPFLAICYLGFLGATNALTCLYAIICGAVSAWLGILTCASMHREKA